MTWNMENGIGLTVTLLFVISWSISPAQGLPCGEAEPIPHGNVKYLAAGRLVQHFCDSGYMAFGSPVLSCVRGQWRGNKPICVAPGCRRLNQPLHSIKTVQLNGAVIRHQCGEGFRMKGEAVIYCDGRSWSGIPPICQSTSTPVLPSLAPYPPENAIEDPGNETEPVSQPVVGSNVNSGERRTRPIFVGPSDKPPVFHPEFLKNMRADGALPLYKRPGQDDEHGDAGHRKPTPPREIQMPPAISGIQPPNANMPPMIPGPRIFQPGYSYTNQRRVAYDRYGMYGTRGLVMPRSPYLPRPRAIYPNSFIMSRTAMRPVLLNRGDEVHTDRMVTNNLQQKSGLGVAATQSPQGSDSERRIPVIGHVVPLKTPSIVNTGRESTLEHQNQDRTFEQPAVNRGNTGESVGNQAGSIVPEVIQSIQVPRQDRKTERNGAPRRCPPATKPINGFSTTHPLPRDYEGDEYQYFIRYHCLPGLNRTSGDDISYCTVKGRWTGQVPRCEKVVKCKTGFIKQASDHCVDIDECASDNGGCPQECENYPGGFRCGCQEGFEISGNGTCLDIDECSPEKEQICNHFCHNTQGSYRCTCREGYVVMRDNRTCLDINECVLSAPCDHLCQNTFGSFRCACRKNFRLGEDGRTCSEFCQPGYIAKEDPMTHRMSCADEDECMEHGGLSNCGQICNNTEGSYFCSCKNGYKLNEDGQTCSDLNECEAFSLCEYGCINTEGSYLCSCPVDQIPSEDGLSCIGCERNSYMEDGICVSCPENTITENIAATSRDDCICQPGYRGNPSLDLPCSDVDECEDDNYGCSHNCINTPGSVFCDCPRGFILGPDGRNCQDRDECSESSNPCKRGGLCRNTEGGYNCTCLRGFHTDPRNPRACVDINECLVNKGGCQGRCHNFPGGYRCSCYASWRLDRDGKSCVPLGGSCPPLQPLANGRVLPEAPCIRVDAAITGRACFYFCNGGYRLAGSNRRRCGPDGWSGEAPECVAKSQCPPLVVPVGVRVIPPTCSETSSLPWKMCVFSCEDQRQMMKGRRATRCIPGTGWDHRPPTCGLVASAASNASAIPRIKCPQDIDVDLAPGQSVAKVTIARPVTNMEITEQRNDGSTSRDIFPAGTTKVKFTAFTNDRRRQDSCIISVHVRDKEAPTIQRCPGSINIESSHEYPEISWQPPLFRDNVEVANVKESRHPAGNITWGTYSVSYTASDGAGNMAECAFTIIIKRPKMSQKQGVESCGEPSGPANGQASCSSWARGVYCVPTCNAGFAFERAPPTYVCDEEGVWTPGRIIPDCIDMRTARVQASSRKTTTSTTTTTSSTVPLTEQTSTEAFAITTREDNSDFETSPVREIGKAIGTSSSTSPAIKILEKPTFFLVPLETDSSLSRKRPNPVRPPILRSRPTIRQGVSQPRLIKLAAGMLECPRGQVPQEGEDGSNQCVDCPEGHYRPRIATAVTCIPCKPGFYQDKRGKAYCNFCPNYQQGWRASALHGREDLMGLTSVAQCERIGSVLVKSIKNTAIRRALARRRRLLRPR